MMVFKLSDADQPERDPDTPKEHSNIQPVVRSEELFRDRDEVLISHDGAVYRLRITRQGKLILNK